MTSYATIAEFRAQIDKQQNETGKPSSDVNVQLMLDAATMAINNLCLRPDGFVSDSVASARIYAGTGKMYLQIDEFTEVTLVEVKDSPSDSVYTIWASSDWLAFRGDSRFPEFNSLVQEDPRPYTGIMISATGSRAVFTDGNFRGIAGFPPYEERGSVAVPTVRVTSKWGFAVTVPATIKEACIAQAARWLKRGEGVWSDMLSTPDMGQVHYTKAMDPDITLLIKMGRYMKVPL